MTLVALAATCALGASVAPPAASGMRPVGPGVYQPVYPPSPEETELPVAAFLLDESQVTNAQFLEFVTAHPTWRRDRVSRLFADESYLAHWNSAEDLGQHAQAEQPVTHVSWFAAKSYCECQGKRLPTENEWEFAASASERSVDGREDPVFVRRILDWYARPSSETLRRVGSGPANYWGIRDLHGLVWEWVLDFNSAMVSFDNRENGGADVTRFCGATALAAADKSDYAAFMRIAFRSSLKSSYTTSGLGFRCARSVATEVGAP